MRVQYASPVTSHALKLCSTTITYLVLAGREYLIIVLVVFCNSRIFCVYIKYQIHEVSITS